MSHPRVLAAVNVTHVGHAIYVLSRRRRRRRRFLVRELRVIMQEEINPEIDEADETIGKILLETLLTN